MRTLTVAQARDQMTKLIRLNQMREWRQAMESSAEEMMWIRLGGFRGHRYEAPKNSIARHMAKQVEMYNRLQKAAG